MRLSKKLTFLSLYVILCIISAEIILQLISFGLYLRMQRQYSFKGADFTIMCLGDSFTYGLGAPAEYSYPSQLERILKREYAPRHFRVINLGSPGYNSSLCLKALKDNFDTYKPNVVIVLAGFNNRWNFTESNFAKISGNDHATTLDIKIKLLEGILLKSKVYKLGKIIYTNLTAGKKQTKTISLPPREFPQPKRSAALQELIAEGVKSFMAGEYISSEAAFRKAMELSLDDYEPHWYMGRFYMYRGDFKNGLASFIFAAKHAPYPYTATCILTDIKNGVGAQEFSGIFQELRGIIVEKFGEEYVRMFMDPMVHSEYSDLEKLLAYDLTEMAHFIRQRNARMVILTYPYSATKFGYSADIYYRIGYALNVPVLDNVLIFNRYAKKFPHQELFSTDGHWSKKGYGLMANNLFALLRQRCVISP